MIGKQQGRLIAAKIYVLHDHIRRFDPQYASTGNDDAFIRIHDLTPILQEIGFDPTQYEFTEQDIEEAQKELGIPGYCLTQEGEELPIDPQQN